MKQVFSNVWIACGAAAAASFLFSWLALGDASLLIAIKALFGAVYMLAAKSVESHFTIPEDESRTLSGVMGSVIVRAAMISSCVVVMRLDLDQTGEDVLAWLLLFWLSIAVFDGILTWSRWSRKRGKQGL